jgi:hypothetical protein
MNTVNNERQLQRDAECVVRSILSGLPDLRVTSKVEHHAADTRHDVDIEVDSGKAGFRFAIEVKSRVTPQTALSVCQRLHTLPEGTIPVIYAPVISPRVAEIARQQGVGYVDRAGNCWLRSLHGHLLIERQGFHSERQPTPAAADPFSTKSSRIVRAMLSRPKEGWQVRKLAEHPDVQVSPGLVVKVKRALVEEGYAVERERLLFLRDPMGLLTAWSQKYSGPAEQVPVYVRGDASAAEQTVSRWCRDNGLQFALAGFSAAWRLAPDVRYNVAAVYVEDRGFGQGQLDLLATKYGGQRVDTGPNMYLWRPFDRSVFASIANAGQPEQPATSPLQTYLDLKRAAGRGEDAANAVFEKYLSRDLQATANREGERRYGTI